ncbi:hypothetical protein BH09BAC3_BH09BAC3_38190 [soil metagenome]
MNKIYLVRLFSVVIFTVVCSSFGQVHDDFQTRFKRIAAIFEKSLEPYAMKFAKASYSEKEVKDSPKIVEARYSIYIQKAQLLRDELRSAMVSSGDLDYYTNDRITETLQFAYRNHYPGLDYTFFESVAKEVKETSK